MVMSGYNGFDILHAGVANFDCVSVKDLMKRVGRREMFINQLRKFRLTLVRTVLLKGGLNQMMFLRRFRLVDHT